jgi:hypothetical protein
MIDLRFALLWGAAFLVFPLSGLAAQAATGGITDPFRAAIAGAIVGLMLGSVQWLLLRGLVPVSLTYVAASAVGLAAGTALAVALLGTNMTGEALLWRALMAGAVCGIAQALTLSGATAAAPVWAVVVGLGWVAGWFTTRIAGIDLAPRWAVFGATGALVFQLATGLAVLALVRTLR